MTQTELLDLLLQATKMDDLEAALTQFQTTNPQTQWIPFGGRENNRGTIEASADPGRSLVERLTNSIDAILEDEHDTHSGIPDCRTPKEAATAWLNIPQGGLSEMTPVQRRTIAQRIAINIRTGDGRATRVVEVRDRGIGLSPDEMAKTILSLNESNKMQKYYLAGAYGQGGSSTLATSRYILIASRRDHSQIGFTIACYQDLPAEQFKTGRYVYLVLSGSVLVAEKTSAEFAAGTLVKHFGYDLTSYPSPVGPNSVYGLLNQTLFDPVLPVWLDDHEIHGYRRVIKGSRNALNGAVDEGDSETKGPSLSHRVRMFYSGIGDFGRIGIEYWVLERPSSANKKPSASFVNPAKPIVLTLNGQNHAELPQSVIRKDAELTFLGQRLICHIDCNNLTAAGKRSLFVSNREGARRGVVYDLIQQEVVRVLKSDDELIRLNNEAREAGTKEKDESAIQQMRTEVAKLLRLQGIDVGVGTVREVATQGEERNKPIPRPMPPRPHPQPIELHEPPTYIKFVWNGDSHIPFYPGQRRYVRIETDANSTYHNPSNPSLSRINIVSPPAGLMLRGSTPLEGGRLRAIFEANSDAQIGATGVLRVELSRPGLSTLSDERSFKLEEAPPERATERRMTLPPFDIRPVESPDSALWAELDWPDDVNSVASSAQMEEGILVVYYSKVFPKYADQFSTLERRDVVLANSFAKRYEIWLVVHSFLLYRDQQEAETIPISSATTTDSDLGELRERQERCRLANIASMVAAREIQAGQQNFDAD
ncbi:MAG: hypothetical protein M1470_05210 [Bacteroidetes bacterium]|nr:hypothetical protein [Bacteroidota bacterium]